MRPPLPMYFVYKYADRDDLCVLGYSKDELESYAKDLPKPLYRIFIRLK